jgi:ankyrin repeat protein
MSEKKTAKPAKKLFKSADVKDLYRYIERDDSRQAIALAHAASGNYKIHRRASWPRSGSTTVYWPMELAIRKKNIEVLRACIPHVDLFTTDDDDDDERYWSWFEHAWREDNVEVARLFVESTANFKDEDGHWLRLAARGGSIDLLELVLPFSNPSASSQSGETPLMAAAGSMQVEIVKRLLPLSDPDAVDDEGKDALMHALEAVMEGRGSYSSDDRLELFRLLVDACGIERKDAEGKTAIARLVKKNKHSYSDEWKSVPSDVVDILIAAGAKPDEVEAGGESLLMQAIVAGKVDLFDKLLESAKVDQADASGYTPLLKAAKLRHTTMIEKLCPLSDCNRQDPDGMTALMLATENADIASVRALVGRTDRTLRDSKGRTAASIAAKHVNKGDHGTSALLIFLRLFDPKDAKGQGILPHLVNTPELFEAALPFCDPNDQDEDGMTALHKAIEWENKEAFESLLTICDAKIANKEGTTPLLAALRPGRQDMFNALLPLSDVGAANSQGVTALMRAARIGDLDAVVSLMPRSNPDAVDHEGRNALMHSCDVWGPDEELIFFLADRSDLSVMDKDGKSAAEIAKENFGDRHPKIVGKLLGKKRSRDVRGELLNEIADPKKPEVKRKSISL